MSNPFFSIRRDTIFEHHGRNGTQLRSPRADLQGCEVLLKRPTDISDVQFAADVAEIMCWWTTNIYNDMISDGKGYPGFDTIQWKVVGYVR